LILRKINGRKTMAGQKLVVTEITEVYLDLGDDGKSATLSVKARDGQQFGFAMPREVLDRLKLRIDAALKSHTQRTAPP
jgi:hypothetical protein